jgi:hypothetical protein
VKFTPCDDIRELQEQLRRLQLARDEELQLMLLARGDSRGASIARGDDSSTWPPATTEHDLCSNVLRVQGWGQVSMQIEQLQVPVLVLELCSCTLADFARKIEEYNLKQMPVRMQRCAKRRLTCEETQHIARQLVLALASMHKGDVAHRDIKPGDSGNDRIAELYQHVMLASGSMGTVGAHCTGHPLTSCAAQAAVCLCCACNSAEMLIPKSQLLVSAVTMCMRQ